jgi:hypothetical protein
MGIELKSEMELELVALKSKAAVKEIKAYEAIYNVSLSV